MELLPKIYLVFGLVAILAVGFLGFWYYKNQSSSSQTLLQLQILGPGSAAMGDQITYTVSYKNTSSFKLQNPTLIFELPDNSLTEDSKTMFSQTLSDIAPGGQGSMQFQTRLFGKEGDLEVAHASLLYTPQNLSAQYESDASMTTTLSSIPLTLSFSLPTATQTGKTFGYDINYFSNINYPLENLSIKVDPVSGFTITSASPVSLDNIEWKLNTLNDSQGGAIHIDGVVGANAPAQLNFVAHLGMWVDGSFVIIKDISQTVQVSNSLQANSLPAPSASPTVVAKPSSHLGISQKADYGSDPSFQNSGPIPPQVNVPTSYTITWQVSNDINGVANVKVASVLPSNVSLTAILPESQIPNVSLNAATHQLVWLVGNVPAGAGENVSAPMLVFQVTLIPTASQQGSAAPLIGQTTISGQDQYADVTVSSLAPAVDTSFSGDPTNSGGGIVQ